jgi:hypothetical protein
MTQTIDGVTFAKTIKDHTYISVDTIKGQRFFADFNKIYANSRFSGKMLEMYKEARATHSNLYLNV